MAHAKVLLLEDVHLDHVPGRPRYAKGERYDVHEDLAHELVRSGAADPVDVPDQVLADGTVVPETSRMALLERLREARRAVLGEHLDGAAAPTEIIAAPAGAAVEE